MTERRGWILLVIVAVVLTALGRSLLRAPLELESWSGVWEPVKVAGSVHAPNVRVECYEAGSDEFQTAVTDERGEFGFAWRRRTSAPLILRAAIEAGKFAPTVVKARPEWTDIDLAVPADGRGRVVDVEGRPVAGVQVAVAPQFGRRARETVSGKDGSFAFTGLPRGRPIDLVISGEGILPRVERRFRGGEFMTLRAHRGRGAQLEIRDPFGRRVAGTVVRLDLPHAFRSLAIPIACDSAGRLVGVDAPGFLPARVELAPHRRAELILWPERSVTLWVRDPVRKRGVTELSLEVDIRPRRGRWRAGIVGGALRDFPRRRGDDAGEYQLRLPACAIHLRLSAPGYGDAEIDLARDQASGRVWLRPLPRRAGGVLTLSGDVPEGFPLVVAGPTGRWRRVLSMRGGRAEIEVPPGQTVRIASVGAWEGAWLPKLNVAAPARGRKKQIRVHTSPAVLMHLDVAPPVDGEVRASDTSFETLKRPQRVPLRAGRAAVWVRPRREIRIDVASSANHFPVSFRTLSERQEFHRRVDLRPAAGVRFRVQDRGGNAIPFARTRLWEPARSGQQELRVPPRTRWSGADGATRASGLRGGDLALEFSARGFRTRFVSMLRLKEGDVLKLDPIVLEPAGLLAGIILDYDRKPVQGVWVRALAPRVRRVPMPGGGERDAYDLTSDRTGQAATDARGRFEVPDATARAPLIACFPTARPDLVATAFAVAPELGMAGTAYVQLDVPGNVDGIYRLLAGRRAVLIAVDPPMSLRPLPVKLPAGKTSLFVRLRDRRWAAAELDLARGQRLRLSPEWHDPLR